MKKIQLSLAFSLCLALTSEELTFVCDYKISQLNFAPTQNTINGWGQTYRAGEADGYKNLCRQRELIEKIRTNNPYLSYSSEDCEESERKKIFIDTESGFFKINQREFQVNFLDDIKKSEPTRECFKTSVKDTKLCKDTSSYIRFEDDVLRLNIMSRYKPEWCPVIATWDEVSSFTNEEEKDQYIEVCLGLGDKGFLDGNRTFIEINRSSLEYSQQINVRSLAYRNGELEISHTRGYGFKAVWASWSDIEDEIGSCKLHRKQF